jgi:hypothetical protein
MACPDFAISATGRQGIGVIQPQSGLDYPLVGPSVFTTRDYARNIRYLLADFYFEYDDPAEYSAATKTAHPLRIKYLYGLGCIENTPVLGFPTPVHDADIVLVDANNTVVFDTTAQPTEFASAAWGADYNIYTWKQARAMCRLVAYTTWSAGDKEKQQFHRYLFPPDAVLDERAVYKLPRRLLSVSVRNGDSTTDKSSNPVVFLNGYNTEISPAAPTATNFRANTDVTFAAVAGSGKGKYTDCTEIANSKPITKINGVGADAFGNFLLSSSDCLWARRPTAYDESGIPTPLTTAQLQLGADCGPCCSCANYADTAKYMNDTSVRYKLIGQRAEDVRTYHEQNIARWLDQYNCSLQRPLKLVLAPQGCPYVDVIALLCNNCQTCIEPTTLTLLIDVTGGDDARAFPTLECGYSETYATGLSNQIPSIGVLINNAGYPYGFTFALPQIKPNDSAYIKFRLKVLVPGEGSDPRRDRNSPDTEERPNGPYTVSGTLTATVISTNVQLFTGCPENGEGSDVPGETPVAAVATAAANLHCNERGRTEEAC